jgi:PAS domain-containing protein
LKARRLLPRTWQASWESSVLVLENHTPLVTRDGQEISIEESAAPILDTDGRVIEIDQSGVRFTGRNKDELLGLLCGEVFGCLNSSRRTWQFK